MSNRRTFLKSAALGAHAMMLSSDGLLAQAGASEKSALATMEIKALKPPANGPINVAFVISKGADVLDRRLLPCRRTQQRFDLLASRIDLTLVGAP